MSAVHGEWMVIRWVRRTIMGLCDICGAETEASPGPGPFLEGAPHPVCPLCAEGYAPELARLRNAGRVRSGGGGRERATVRPKPPPKLRGPSAGRGAKRRHHGGDGRVWAGRLRIDVSWMLY